MKGLQLGLVNANPDTKVQMMVYGGNSTAANIGVRFKNQLFYTILGVGSMYQDLNDKFSASASYRAGISFPVYKGLSISGDLGYQHIEAFDNKDEVIPKRLYALQARANLEYQFTPGNSVFLQQVVTDLPGSIINQAITIKVLSLKQALFFSKKRMYV